jgi:hypothetical protein
MKTQEEIEILAKNTLDSLEKFVLITSTKEEENIFCDGFIIGYQKCQEDSKDKKYTEEDIRRAMKYASEITNNKMKYMEDYINSLNKQD